MAAAHSSHPRTAANLAVDALVLLSAALLVGCGADEPVAPTPVDAASSADLAAPRLITIAAAQPLPVPDACRFAVPVDVDDRNTIVGWTGLCADEGFHAVRWDASGAWSYLPEVDGAAVLPFALGKRGEVYAETRVPAGDQHQIVVIDARGRVTRLAFPAGAGGRYGVMGRPNDQGTFVLAYDQGTDDRQYYLWNGRGRVEPIPPPAVGRFEAAGLNDQGVVVGTLVRNPVTDEVAATWHRGTGYRTLEAVGGSTRYSGQLIDKRGRVYGQSALPIAPGCPFADPGAVANRPTAWLQPDDGRQLQPEGRACFASADFKEARSDGVAVGDWVGRTAESPTNAFAASASGLFATAPCVLGEVQSTECHAVGLSRSGLMAGVLITAERGLPVTWQVETR